MAVGLVVTVLNGERFDKPGEEKSPDDTELNSSRVRNLRMLAAVVEIGKSLAGLLICQMKEHQQLISVLLLEVLLMLCSEWC